MKKKLFTWLAMLCFVVPGVMGLVGCKKDPATLTNYKVIVNQQLIAESREINVTYGDEIEWSAIAIYDDNSITAIPVTEVEVVDEDEIIGTTPTVGAYQIKFKYEELKEYVVTLNVNPKALAVPTAEAMVYSGEEQTATLDGFDANTMEVSGNLTATNANTYAVSVALKDKTNYCWTGGSTTDKTVEYTIAKLKLQEPSRVDKVYTYKAAAQALDLVGYEPLLMEVSDNIATNAGEYTAHVDLIDASNYEWKHNSGSRISISWSIEKAIGTAPATAPTGLTGVYDPAKTLADYAVAANYTWADETIVPTVAVKEYAVIYNPDSTNYTDYEMTYGLDLAKAQLVVPTFESEIEFDGTEKTATFSHFNADLMRVTGNKETEIGSHTAVVVIENNNYEFVGGEISTQVAWTIGKGTPVIEIPYNYSKPYDTYEINAARYQLVSTYLADELTGEGLVTVKYYNASSEEVVRTDIKEAGTYTMVVSTAETAHYKAGSKSCEFQIYYDLAVADENKLLIVNYPTTVYYDGNAKTPQIDVTFKLDGSSTITLEEDVDYTIEYFNNVDVDAGAYAVVTGQGKFRGSVKQYFTIRLNAREMLATTTVAGKSAINDVVALTRNEAGYQVVLNVADDYESLYKNYGEFTFTANNLNSKHLVYDQVIDSDTLTFTVPVNTRSIYIEYDGYSAQEIYIKDEVSYTGYILLPDPEKQIDFYSGDINGFMILSSATQSWQNVISSTAYGVYGGYSIAEKVFGDYTVTFKLTKDSEADLYLTYDVFDRREGYGDVQVHNVYVNGENVNVVGSNTLTVENLERDYLYVYWNSYGNTYGYDVYFNSVKLGELSQITTNMSVDIKNALTRGAGTYEIRIFKNVTDYVTFTIVIENVTPATEQYLKVELLGQEFTYASSQYDSNVNFKMESREVGYMYVYAGTLASGVNTVNAKVTVSTSLQGYMVVYGSDMQPVADLSNVTLQVLTEGTLKYTVLYFGAEGTMVPFIAYFIETPEYDVLFDFEGRDDFVFSFDYEQVSSTMWQFGDFVTMVDPEIGKTYDEEPFIGKKVIELYGLASKTDIGYLVGDTTIAVDITCANSYVTVQYSQDGFVSDAKAGYDDVHSHINTAEGSEGFLNSGEIAVVYMISSVTDPNTVYAIYIIAS